MTTNQSSPWYQLIGRISRLGELGKGHSKEIAALRRAGNPVTEHYAYPYVLPYSIGLNEDQKTALLRIAAALTEYREIPLFNKNGKDYQSFGTWCYWLSKYIADGKNTFLNPDDPDAVGQRLAYLHTQSIEEAAQSVRRLLALADSLKSPPALDKYNLAKTLIYWGNGVSPGSRKVRRQVLRDYYSSFNYTIPQAENDSLADNQ